MVLCMPTYHNRCLRGSKNFLSDVMLQGGLGDFLDLTKLFLKLASSSHYGWLWLDDGQSKFPWCM